MPTTHRGNVRTRLDDAVRVALLLAPLPNLLGIKNLAVSLGVAAILLFLLGYLALRFFGRLVVGIDGVRVEGVGVGPRFLSFHMLREVRRGAMGQLSLLPTHGDAHRLSATSRKGGDALEQAVRGHTDRVEADRAALGVALAALDRPAAKWAERLTRSSSDAAYRDGVFADEDLLARVLVSPASSPLARAGAAILLREAGETKALAAAAAECVHRPTCELLDALAVGDEARARATLAAWTEPSTTPTTTSTDDNLAPEDAEIVETNVPLHAAVWALAAWPAVLAAGVVTGLTPLMVLGCGLPMVAGIARAWLVDRNPLARRRKGLVRATPAGLEVEGHGVLDGRAGRTYLHFVSGRAPTLRFEGRWGWPLVEVRGATEEVTRGWMESLGAAAHQRPIDFPTLSTEKGVGPALRLSAFGVWGVVGWALHAIGLGTPAAVAVGFACALPLLTLHRRVRVAPSGIELVLLWRRRWIPFEEVDRIERGISGGNLVLRDGEVIRFRDVEDDAPATEAQRADFLVERAHDAFLSFRARSRDLRVDEGATARQTQEADATALVEDAGEEAADGARELRVPR